MLPILAPGKRLRAAASQTNFVKAAIGCNFIFGALDLVAERQLQLVTDAHGRTPLLWAVAFHLASEPRVALISAPTT